MSERRKYRRGMTVPTVTVLGTLLVVVAVIVAVVSWGCGATLPTVPTTILKAQESTPEPTPTEGECSDVDTSDFYGWAEGERCQNGRGRGRPIPFPLPVE